MIDQISADSPESADKHRIERVNSLSLVNFLYGRSAGCG
ncbi:MAG: hypothetical protein ACI90U_000334 [Pseudomonadales bacterium]|jgi:hypothetical protein